MRIPDAIPRSVPVDVNRILPVAGFVFLALASFVLGPTRITTLIIGTAALVVIAARPSWGVATLMTMLMVQYGSRRFERTGGGALASLIPAGTGLLTVNNVLGLFLGILLVHQVYQRADWSFLRSRQVRLALGITAALIVSSLFNDVDYEQQISLGLRVTGQDPMRMLATRAAFLVFFVAFVQRPRELKLLVGVFLGLVLVTAYSGSAAALGGGSDVPQAATYRAGGLGVLIETAGNPNRLALVATLGLIFIWEHGQSGSRRRWVWVNNLLVVFLVLTVFLTASRGGVIGMSVAALLLFLRRRGVARRVIYGLIVALVASVLISEVLPEASKERLSNVPGVSEQESGEGYGSLERRQYTYGVAYRIWSESPVIGVGLGNWEFKRFTLDPLHSAAVPHNSLILAVTEGGVLTAGLYLLLFGVTARKLGELERNPAVVERAREEGTYWLIRATRVAVLTFFAFSMFGDLWELIFFYFLFGLGGSLLLRYGDPHEEAGAPA